MPIRTTTPFPAWSRKRMKVSHGAFGTFIGFTSSLCIGATHS